MLILDPDGAAHAGVAELNGRPRGGVLLLRAARVAGTGATAGMLAGLVWGIGARGAMRVMALAAHQHPEFSLAGTVMILVVGLILGMPLGLLYSAARPKLPPARWARASIAGALTLMILGYPFYAGPLREEAVLRHQWLALLMFFGLLVLLGVLIEVAYVPIERRVAAGTRRVAVAMVLASGTALAFSPVLAKFILDSLTG